MGSLMGIYRTYRIAIIGDPRKRQKGKSPYVNPDLQYRTSGKPSKRDAYNQKVKLYLQNCSNPANRKSLKTVGKVPPSGRT